MLFPLFPPKGSNDLFAVKAAILDKYLPNVVAANHHASQVNSWHVALESLRIHRRLIGLRIEGDAQLPEEIEVRVIAGQGKDLSGGQRAFSIGSLHPDLGGLNAGNARLEQRANLPGLDRSEERRVGKEGGTR